MTNRAQPQGPFQVEFPDEGFSITMEVLDLGEQRYLLLGVPLGSETYSIGDTVLAEPRKDGGLNVLRKAERSDWITLYYYVPKSLIEGGMIGFKMEKLEEMGGYAHTIYEGLLFLCIPPGVKYEPADDVGPE